jgi:hypothetical protein
MILSGFALAAAIVWVSIGLIRFGEYTWQRRQPEYWDVIDSNPQLAPHLPFYKSTAIFWDVLSFVMCIVAGPIYTIMDIYGFVHSKV